MKIPGTPGRKIDNPLSPTFREEQILEKHEDMTEKEQAKDLVNLPAIIPGKQLANNSIESQDKSPDGQVHTPRCELQLQSHCSGDALNDLLDLQCH